MWSRSKQTKQKHVERYIERRLAHHWPRTGAACFCKYTVQAAPHSISVALAVNAALRHWGCSLGKSWWNSGPRTEQSEVEGIFSKCLTPNQASPWRDISNTNSVLKGWLKLAIGHFGVGSKSIGFTVSSYSHICCSFSFALLN